MKLNEIKLDFLSVVRDGEFLHLGALNDERAQILVRLEEKRFLPKLSGNGYISAVLTTSEIAPLLPETIGVIVCEEPNIDFFRFHNFLCQHTEFYGVVSETQIHSSSFVHPSAVIDEWGVSIGPNCHIGPNVVIHSGSRLSANVIVRSGSVVGCEGFYFKRKGNEVMPVLHGGGVWLGENVEVQANCSIDKGIFGDDTILGQNTKIDNMVHIAHSVRIGQACLIAAQATIAGCVEIGDRVWIGPGANVSSSIAIGDDAQIAIGSTVVRNVKSHQHVSGNFAIDHDKFLSHYRDLLRLKP